MAVQYKFKASNKESGDFVTLEADTYDASFLGVEEFSGGQFGPALKFKFLTVSDAGDVEISGLASIPQSGNLTLKSKMRAWIEALMGRALADDEAIDLATLSNTPCRLVLDVVSKKRDDGSESTFNKIIKVLPPKKRAGKPKKDEEELF